MTKSKGRNISKETTNSGYTNKRGITYGLYQRFYWDVDKVEFGGIPNARTEMFAPNISAAPKLPPKSGG